VTRPGTTGALLAIALAPCSCETPEQRREAFLALGITGTSAPPIEGVYCSGQPTERQFERLEEIGIKHVVTLRRSAEPNTGWEVAKAAELGIDFVRLPITSPEDINLDATQRLVAALGSERPVLVTCGSSNRVGALFALKAHFLDGASIEDAMALGRACGLTRLEPVVTKARGR